MIEDVLNYSKIVRASLPLHPIQTDKFIREIVESYPNLQSARAEIRVEGPIPPVLANSAALTQVVSNLLGNAVKFHSKDQKPKIHVGVVDKPDHWLFSVRDNGIGMNPAYKDRVFLIFQRLHGREEFPGTGIGLAIVARAVERMEGRCGVESVPGRGCLDE